MTIVESIKKARERGASDDDILQEIIRQNREKGEVFSDRIRKGEKPTNILEELIEEENNRNKIEEIKRKIRALKEDSNGTGKEENLNQKEKPVTQIKVNDVKEYKDNIEDKSNISEEIDDTDKYNSGYEEDRWKNMFQQSYLDKQKGIDVSQNLLKNNEDINKMSSLKPDLPPKPNPKIKFWIRIIIFVVSLIILSGVATFWYWFFVIRNQLPEVIVCSSNSDCKPGQICNEEGSCVNAPQQKKCSNNSDCKFGQICISGSCIKKQSKNIIPQPLFSVDKTEVLKFSNFDEIKSLLKQSLQEWQDKNQFRRIVFRNSKDNTIIGLKKFFESLLIRVPDSFYQKIDDNFTLFIYSQEQGNRIGFVAKIKNYNGLEDMLRAEEPKMKNDFQTLISLIGKENVGMSPYFRNASTVRGYNGPNFRYRTLNRQDLGILYLTSGNYFLFTSSWKSMEDVIKRLKITGTRLEITTRLKFGDKGYEVKLLQSWLSQDPTVYPQAIVNGSFGYLTKKAVIRFQEKYASEILAPQGFVKGNGIVDSYTRMKLNELYGNSGIKPRTSEITTELRIGSHGEEVKLLQIWLSKDSRIYPEAITSGYFGYLTKKAVIRFQEKYASEILAPQGLKSGTGIVDILTRKKLNELYGGK